LVLGTALPVLAKDKGTDHPTPPTSSKAGSKGIPLSCASSTGARAKADIHKKSENIVTSDVSRSAASASLLAKQESAPETPTVTVRAQVEHAQARAISDTAAEIVRNSSVVLAGAIPVRTASGPLTTESDFASDSNHADQRLARVTAYWADEGDYYTGRGMSATGVRLHDGLCAVDPNIIPYGSVVEIAGVGKYLAVDTGSAVINRTAAREGGHTEAERHAIVVDIYFEDASEGERFAAGDAKYVSITWWTPRSVGVEAKAARSLFADENWTKIQSKQL
jgi:3D (Asp-Asp-Asp) domain-containing protein